VFEFECPLWVGFRTFPKKVFARIGDHPVWLLHEPHERLPWTIADRRYRPDQREAA
jgi:hypothetical protein